MYASKQQRIIVTLTKIIFLLENDDNIVVGIVSYDLSWYIKVWFFVVVFLKMKCKANVRLKFSNFLFLTRSLLIFFGDGIAAAAAALSYWISYKWKLNVSIIYV